jgi:hypothetical protein
MPVAQLGPGMLFLDSPCNCPPAEGSIVFRVDGSERSWGVYLPNGASSDSKKVAIEALRRDLPLSGTGG